ncbi:hypothetical protein RhiirC2_848494 [Rhizophagus irregularis]|uniref:Uncharacterized protein n=1 Tax=Rhizophagus irregularis TaxID=588596 RepID=A0A2N1NEF9_9GLOM|nr:hypothetical protein RhiirC2_848494 [Rhizophagus irregularis]
MAKSNNYSGLNPVVVQALSNLQYRYSEWMIERSYKDGEFKAGRRSFHIYCTKYLGITPRDTYVSYVDWIFEKKYQLCLRLANVTYDIVFKILHQRGYKVVRGSDWSNQLKWLQNPEYYRIDKDNIEYLIRVTEC